jgi:hypothetical protein
MKEIVYDIEEFKARVDESKPLHHCAKCKSVDKYGVFYRIVFRIYGIDKKNGHIIIFEAQKRASVAEVQQHQKRYERFVEKYAEPLGSTEGMWIQ